MQPVEYREVRAFSQSSLKLLDFNVNKFYKEEYLWVIGQIDTRKDESTPAMGLGSMVDVLSTGKEGDYENEYKAVECVLQPQLREYIEEFVRLETTWGHGGFEDWADKIGMQAYSNVGIKQSKYDTIKARFQAEGLTYYNELKKAKASGKIIVTKEKDDYAKLLYKGLCEDEFTGPIITQETDTQSFLTVDIVVYNQLAIYFEAYGLKFKALLDKVIVDHIKKTISPYDIKTTSSSDFTEAFGKYRYDIQGAFYTDALHHWMKENGMKDYEIKPFTFIVAFTNEKGIGPQLWQMCNRDYHVGRFGIYEARVKIWIRKGYQTLIKDLEWHIKENKWKYPLEVYKNNGIRMLNHYADDPYKH